jgi:CubicO group peptidase (beta-lactamase class C family)
MLLTRRRLLGRAAWSVGGASLLGTVGHARDASWRDGVADLERRIPTLMAEFNVPGVSIAVIRDASVAWRRGFGVRSRASSAPVDHDTVFEGQSMSKPVFAYRVMKLCERGVLDLDAPLTRYTPDRYVENDARLDLVTARRVLSHTTGWPNWRRPDDPLRFNFTPGERWSYSGEGYSYLQSVVTRLVGRVDPTRCGDFEMGYRVCATDFGDDMAAHLLKPFGMTRSGYVWTETLGRNQAAAHDRDGKPFARHKSTAIDVARYGSAGSLLTTAGDYAKFLIEVMAAKPADAFRLTGASLSEMLRPQVAVPGSPIPTSWALGWQVWRLEKGEAIAHGGDDDGFHSQAVFFPARRSGFVILTNGDGGADLIWKGLLTGLVERLQ